jgi:hypothetical protein
MNLAKKAGERGCLGEGGRPSASAGSGDVYAWAWGKTIKTNLMKRSFSITVIIALGMAAAAPRLQAQKGDKCFDRNGSVISPHRKPFGKTYGEWSALWWRWCLGMPVSGHPLFDQTGENVAAGQSGPVWFLGGTLQFIEPEPGHLVGIASRTVRVPTGKALFFPILNHETDNVGLPSPLNTRQLRAWARALADRDTNLTCLIDGRPVAGLSNVLTTAYRVSSSVFSYELPETNNIYQFWGVDVSGRQYPAVDDGVYLMLAPLAEGFHTIHFAGDSLGEAGTPVFSLDITYNIFASAHPPLIVPPTRQAYGKTYSEWSAEWWKWCLGLPVTGHPLFDPTGANAAAGQSGPVWFLGGTFTATYSEPGHAVGVANRTIVVPPGKALFFPILNVEVDQVAWGEPLPVEELRDLIRANQDADTNMVCTIDGVRVSGLANALTSPYRVESPVFGFSLPPVDNLYQSYGIDFSGPVYPAVADGVFLMLRPLPPGFHRIQFSGDVMGPGGTPTFSLAVSYDITVDPHYRNDRPSAPSPAISQPGPSPD